MIASPLAVVMPHFDTDTNLNLNLNPNLKPSCAIITILNEHDVVHFSGRPQDIFYLIILT